MHEAAFDVIVIGGGHAGVEAAWAAANLLPARGGRASVALVTMDASKIGAMSCNPAIGGLAKGQLVREIDAMGGLMGLATDATAIQVRVLNAAKGPAVQGPRAQCDKHAYAEQVQRMIAARPEIRVIEGSVEALRVEQGRVRGVVVRGSRGASQPGGSQARDSQAPTGTDGARNTCSGRSDGIFIFELSSRAVVLTTGTFMRGLMHTGQATSPGGRFGEDAAVGISGALRELGFELGRLKTGTPPRIRRGSIDWESLAPQHGDDNPIAFSDLSGRVTWRDGTDREVAFGSTWNQHRSGERCHQENTELKSGPWHAYPSLARFPVLPQVECRQTSTTPGAHDLIRANLHRAPMYSGQIEGVGPRYCPSIEDKVVRFAERERHGVFLEPESLRDDWVYCNGISTSLPRDVQDVIVRSMPGCERAEILRYGYAVEYDTVRPHQILATGMTRLVGGLFLAGQINGTSGYEEAAAQGLVAGINAARLARGEGEFVLGREEAYIGVLMDDLVTKTPLEPYRMFTSRAEHRLLLRSDNAPERLTPIAEKLGLLASRARNENCADGSGNADGECEGANHVDLGRARRELFSERERVGEELNRLIDAIKVDATPLDKLIRTPGVDARDIEAKLHAADAMLLTRARACGVLARVLADRLYMPYVAQQRAQVRRAAEMEHRRIPGGVDFTGMPALRAETRQALAKFRPTTFGQASRLEGVTPADMMLLSVLLTKHARNGSSEAVPG
ncbi:MAG: tRNA uridine-5-carboxymethylaminomethyl(34) synthesis enzyme MnmG [Phycisphaerae bacterium]|nr:tRNA uridine-5-carboxymethylaminomethyl(34) synthesis enzyme MnmG [Phycisphaerae bacterium]